MTHQPVAQRGWFESGDVVCCVAGAEQYAIAPGEVCSVARAEQIHREPLRNGRVGTLRHESASLPLYRLSALLHPESTPPGDERHIIVARGAAGLFGLAVDRIVRTPLPDGAAVLPLPALVGPVSASWFRGLLAQGDRSCLILSPASLGRSRPADAVPVARHEPARAPASGARAAAADMVAIFSSRTLPSCAADTYAIDARRVMALVQSLPMVAIPGSPPHVTALAWWRDTAVPVIDVSRGAARANGGRADRYLIARCGSRFEGALVAVAIGRDITLHRATEEDRGSGGGAAASPAVRGVFTIGGQRVALLDVDSLLADLGTPDVGGIESI